MTKTYKSFILFFIIIIIILLFFLKKYNDIIKQDQLDILVSKNIELINSELSSQKKHALSLAILFSKNQNIIAYLKLKQHDNMKKELNSLINTITNYTKLKNIQIQVHTKDLKVFVRSWEDKDTGLSLESFRKGLVKVKESKQPYVSNELGKRLNIKAISPIYDKKDYIGSIEVIMDYSLLKQRLQVARIDILPILEKKYLNIAKYHQHNKEIGDYKLLEKNYDKKLFDILAHNKYILKNDKFYYDLGEQIISMVPLGHIDNKNVGYLVVSFKKIFDDFNYLPKYEYTGGVISNKVDSSKPVKKKDIFIE